VNTLNRPLDGLDMAEARAVLETQRDDALGAIAAERTEVEGVTVLHGADMQFRGQTHLIRVSLPHAGVSREETQALFEAAYLKRFQVRLPEIRAVVVNLVTSAIGRRKPFPFSSLLDCSARRATLDEARIGRRPFYAEGRWRAASVYARDALPAGARIEGPAVVQQMDATTVVEPGAVAVVDAIGNLRIKA
jgi:N-methylhydantoinase A